MANKQSKKDIDLLIELEDKIIFRLQLLDKYKVNKKFDEGYRSALTAIKREANKLMFGKQP